MTSRYADLGKQLEGGRAERRARAARTVAENTAIESYDPEPEHGGPSGESAFYGGTRKQRTRVFSEERVDALRQEIEVGINDALRDYPDLTTDDVGHDIAWNALYCARGVEHPDTIREVARMEGVDLWGMSEHGTGNSSPPRVPRTTTWK